ncbi:MAG: filamentous hemagglutinin N-terminal domain-containing protein [Trichormus sp. ATA11-4-KO1]|jgi:filamentous hemagglutinin family protein|nr:filamentous hemagglutinin N-terminal domain-containing protein [Trichormus sp. ATA11-4-KO1]
MKTKYSSFLNASVVSLFISFSISVSSEAQITQDISLPNNTNVKIEDNNRIVEGGTQLGNNLFHSFSDFSVPTGSIVHFNNPLDIRNIITRVTGSSLSNIDGLIRANGMANLFLLNPNGIVFGQNARLDIGGSFVSSTANSLNFADGTKFSVRNPKITSLLTVSVPVGLQFGSNSGTIEVQGNGHTIQPFDVLFPLNISNFSGLQVNPGKTLALIGRDILLKGGILTSADGRIELGSVNTGEVDIRQINDSLFFDYEKVTEFSKINSLENSLVYVGSSEGAENSINIQGSEIRTLDGSLIISQNYGSRINGGIDINASKLLEVKGQSQFITSGIFTSNFLQALGEKLEINSREIIVEGAQIATTSFSEKSGGNLSINNVNHLRIAGTNPSPVNPLGFGGINTFSYASGSGGDIFGIIKNVELENRGSLAAISTSIFFPSSGQSGNLNLNSENILIKSGSSLGSLTFSGGDSGSVNINAKKSVQVIGQSPFFEPSLIQSATFGAGNAGNLEINTSRILVRDGGTINTSTVSLGNAGNLNIQASDLIEVSGINSNSKRPSSISSSGTIAEENLRQRFNLPPTPSGNSGNVRISTGRLNVTNGSQVSVFNVGSGNAGVLQIEANNINVLNTGSIVATTAIGQGGDITLQSKYIQLRNGDISATAGQQGSDGNGGNITINTDILLAIKNSSITANAFEGRGGNIKIDTKGLFLSPDSQITASSERGIDGTVQINSLIRNHVETTAEPEAVQADTKIASVCQGRSGTIASSKLTITGTGGLPPSSNDLLDSNFVLNNSFVSLQKTDNNTVSKQLISEEPIGIVEAQGLMQNSHGKLFLTAEPNSVIPNTSLSAHSCAGG